jgi:hypothetical protein
MPGRGNTNTALCSSNVALKVSRLITANDGDLREKVNVLIEQYAPAREKEMNDNNVRPAYGKKRSIEDLEILDSSFVKIRTTEAVQCVNAVLSEMQGKEVVMAMQEVCQSDDLGKIIKIHELRHSTINKEIQLQTVKEIHSTNNWVRVKEIALMEQAIKDNDIARSKEKALIEQAAKDNDTARAKEIALVREAAKDADIRRLKEAANIEVDKAQRLLQIRQASVIASQAVHAVWANNVHVVQAVIVHNFNTIVKEVFNGPIKLSLYTSAGAYVRARGFNTFNNYTTPTADRVRALLEAWKEINQHRFQS